MSIFTEKITEEGCIFDNDSPSSPNNNTMVQQASNDASGIRSDARRPEEISVVESISSAQPQPQRYNNRSHRHNIFCIVISFLLAFVFAGLLIGFLASNSASASSSAAPSEELAGGATGDSSMGNTGIAAPTEDNTLTETANTEQSIGLLRSTRIPTTHPTASDIPSFSPRSPTITSKLESTSSNLTQVETSSSSPTFRPSLRPSQPATTTLSKQIVETNNDAITDSHPSTSPTVKPFAIDISNWIETFNSLTLDEENGNLMLTATTTAASISEATTTPTTETTASATTSMATMAETTKATAAMTEVASTLATMTAATISATPTATPILAPTSKSTLTPTSEPSSKPTLTPTSEPSSKPTLIPTSEPASKPTLTPTSEPASKPTLTPTSEPTSKPIATTTGATESIEETSTTVTSSTEAASNWIDTFNTIPNNTNSSINSTTTIPNNTCLTAEACHEQRQKLGFEYYVMVGDESPLKGCFYKHDVAYFGVGGTAVEMSSSSVGQNIRIWCDDDFVSQYNTNNLITVFNSLSTPTQSPATLEPTMKPTSKSTEQCFTVGTYTSIDNDIETLKNNIANAKTRSHFLGGIVRLAAHDFMDYDRNDPFNPMGPDGCFDANHPANAGLPQDIWCSNCALTLLYSEKYTHVSRADFWIASANAVIRQTSINNALDLRESFTWGRADRDDSCPGSGDRLPATTGCASVEDVFLRKMGLRWKDAVALMGAHTLGRGDREFSGHHGTWVDTDENAQRFDKQYYEEIFLSIWRPRNIGQINQDWTTGRPSENGIARLMLNTDICLVHDIDSNLPCCTQTGESYSDGQDRCIDSEAAMRRCPMYSQTHSRWEARQAVGEMLGGSYPNTNNKPFYTAFAEAWRKATTVGQSNLSSLVESCELL